MADQAHPLGSSLDVLGLLAPFTTALGRRKMTQDLCRNPLLVSREV